MRKKETITLSIPPGTKEQLEGIASRLNLRWGNRPSISGLIVALAQQEVEVGARFSLSKVQINSIEQATKLLIDSGYIPEAQTLTALVLERGNPEPPLKQRLLQQVSQPAQAWRVLLDEQLAKKQPFRLFYRDASQKDWEFTVRYGEINFREKRYYLEIWAEETQGNSDVPQLVHNWSLRLDRIQQLTLLPAEGHWREGLDYLKVYLHFYGRLASAYEARQEDISSEQGEIPLPPLKNGEKRVIRKVSNTYWLLREVRAYGQECVIVAPESVREKMKQYLLSVCQHYDLPLQD